MDSKETRYILDLSGSMERILCDRDPSTGQIAAWYIHGSDLVYRIDATNSLTCFHADAMANIIALTGTNGVLLAQYVYDPYGRLLVSTNFQSQIVNPYLFVGSQGVMQELPGLYFMRARYYLADVGTFLSPEPIKRIGPGWQPLFFEYARENPFRGCDPNGLSFTSFFSGIASAVQSAISQAFSSVAAVFSGSSGVPSKASSGSQPQSANAKSGGASAIPGSLSNPSGASGVGGSGNGTSFARNIGPTFIQNSANAFIETGLQTRVKPAATLIAKQTSISAQTATSVLNKGLAGGIFIKDIIYDPWKEAYDDEYNHPDRPLDEAMARYFVNLSLGALKGAKSAYIQTLAPTFGDKVGDTAIDSAIDSNRENIQNIILHNRVTDWYGAQIYGAVHGTSVGRFLRIP